MPHPIVYHIRRAMQEVDFMTDVLPLKDKLFRVAWRITLNREDAEDIVQDTLIKVWNQREEWSAIENPEAYSITVCRHLALDRSKRAADANQRLPPDKGENINDPHPSADEMMSRKETLSLVREAMDALPELQRTMMVLRDMEGKTYREIADILSVPETQVKVYLHRARLKIKTKIEEIEQYGL